MNKLYIDIDYQGMLPQAYDYKQAIVKAVETYYGSVRQYFSGMKGFALYLDFKPQIITNYYFVSRALIHRLLLLAGLITETDFSKLQWKVADPSVLHWSRISKIPYTVHRNSKLFCLPVTTEQSLAEILYAANEPLLNSLPELTITPLDDSFNTLITELEELCPQWLQEQLPDDKELLLTANNLNSWGEDLDLLLLLAAYVTDGRHRLVYSMIVPRMVILGYDDIAIRQYCQTFILATGQEWTTTWFNYVEGQIHNKRTHYVRPWSWNALFDHYPDLQNIFNGGT